jgi:hypothetical protein
MAAAIAEDAAGEKAARQHAEYTNMAIARPFGLC